MLPENFWGDLVGQALMTFVNSIVGILMAPFTILQNLFSQFVPPA